MPRQRRVSWTLIADSTSRANAVKSDMDSALLAKVPLRTIVPNGRSGVTVRGDYVMLLPSDAQAVYDAAAATLQTAGVVRGMCDTHDCDHDTAGVATDGGCVAVSRSEKGTI